MSWNKVEVVGTSRLADMDIACQVRKPPRGKNTVSALSITIKDEILKQLNEPGVTSPLKFVEIEIGTGQHKGQLRLLRGGKHPLTKQKGKNANLQLSTLKVPVKYKAPFTLTEAVYEKVGETIIITLPHPELLESA